MEQTSSSQMCVSATTAWCITIEEKQQFLNCYHLYLRYLTLKRKAQEDVEDKQRQQVLLERKEKQLEATLKFQRNQKNAAKENAKDKQTGEY